LSIPETVGAFLKQVYFSWHWAVKREPICQVKVKGSIDEVIDDCFQQNFFGNKFPRARACAGFIPFQFRSFRSLYRGWQDLPNYWRDLPGMPPDYRRDLPNYRRDLPGILPIIGGRFLV